MKLVKLGIGRRHRCRLGACWLCAPLLVLALVGCPKTPGPQPPPSDADAEVSTADVGPLPDTRPAPQDAPPARPDASPGAVAACARLRASCKVAEPCEVTLDDIARTGFVLVDFKCMAGAATPAAMRACPNVRCDPK